MTFYKNCTGINAYLNCSDNTTDYCTCDCYAGYITVSQDDPCGYEQLSKTVNIILTVLFGVFGVNRCYLSRDNYEYMLIGITKILSIATAVSTYTLVNRITKKINDSILPNQHIHNIWYQIYVYLLVLCICGIIPLWYITDIVCACMNMYPDGNGYDLY